MKKIIFLFVLALGFMSFSEGATVKNVNMDDFSTSISLNEFVVDYSFAIDDAIFGYRCVATVYHYGEPVASFEGYGDTVESACKNATSRARAFINMSIEMGA